MSLNSLKFTSENLYIAAGEGKREERGKGEMEGSKGGERGREKWREDRKKKEKREVQEGREYM